MKTRDKPKTKANVMLEMSFRAEACHANPFTDITLDVEFTDPEGTKRKIPAFWAGGEQWKVRYVSPVTGTHHYRNICSDEGEKAKK